MQLILQKVIFSVNLGYNRAVPNLAYLKPAEVVRIKLGKITIDAYIDQIFLKDKGDCNKKIKLHILGYF